MLVSSPDSEIKESMDILIASLISFEVGLGLKLIISLVSEKYKQCFPLFAF